MVAIIIVPDALKAIAEQAVSQLDPHSVGGSFIVDLSASGQLPATHWACLPIVSDAAAAHITTLSLTPPFAGQASVLFCGPEEVASRFQALLVDIGLIRIEAK